MDAAGMAEIIGTAVAAAVAAGGLATYVERRRQQRRSELPIIRLVTVGSEGVIYQVEVQNRIDEDIVIEAVDGAGMASHGAGARNSIGEFIYNADEWADCPFPLDWRLRAMETKAFPLYLRDVTSELRFTVTSNLGTMRRRKVSVPATPMA